MAAKAGQPGEGSLLAIIGDEVCFKIILPVATRSRQRFVQIKFVFEHPCLVLCSF